MQNIDPIPFWSALKNYKLPSFRADIFAAISVALLALPQAMAYAFVADLPMSAGIWAAVFGTIFTSAFGESRYLISGPTNTVAILLQSGTAEILHNYYRGVTGIEKEALALNIVLQLVLVIGIFQILAGLLHLGRLTHFTSRSVIVGYMAAAASAIIITQLYPFFGIPEQEDYYPLYQQAIYLFTQLPLLHVPTTIIGVGCLVLLIIFYRTSERIPAAAIVFVLAGGAVALLHLSPEGALGVIESPTGMKIEKVSLLKDIGPVFSELPSFRIPDFDIRILPKIVPLAFAISLLSVLEVTAIGRMYTKAKERLYNDNQEIYGLGISNFFSSMLGGMPSSGSFSRSALNYAIQSKTRFAAIFSGVFLFVFVVSLGFFVTQIPLAALSALMLFTGYTMVNFKNLFICLKATLFDAMVVLATFISSLIFTLDVALYIGVILSIVLYLKQAAVPYLVEFAFNNVGKLRPLDPDDERPDPRICIIQTEGELFFGAANLFQTKLRNIAEDESIKVIILQLLNIRRLDASVCLALRQVLDYLKSTNRILMLAGVTSEVYAVLHDSGLLEEIGEEHCFIANEQLPSEPTRTAYALAKLIAS